MAGVDLVPEEFKISRQRHRRMRYWMALIVVVFCAAGALSGVKYLLCLRQDRTAKKVAAEYEELQKDIERLNRERNQLNTWQSQLALLGELGQYVDFLTVTSFLAQNTPSLIYLETMDFISPNAMQSGLSGPIESLPKSAQMFLVKETSSTDTSQASTDSLNMFIKGKAFHYQAVADYLTVLCSTPFFQDVNLIRTWRPPGRALGQSETIRFEIQCRLIPVRIGKGVQYAAMPQTQNF